jgi:hypothetical protein
MHRTALLCLCSDKLKILTVQFSSALRPLASGNYLVHFLDRALVIVTEVYHSFPRLFRKIPNSAVELLALLGILEVQFSNISPEIICPK